MERDYDARDLAAHAQARHARDIREGRAKSWLQQKPRRPDRWDPHAEARALAVENAKHHCTYQGLTHSLRHLYLHAICRIRVFPVPIAVYQDGFASYRSTLEGEQLAVWDASASDGEKHRLAYRFIDTPLPEGYQLSKEFIFSEIDRLFPGVPFPDGAELWYQPEPGWYVAELRDGEPAKVQGGFKDSNAAYLACWRMAGGSKATALRFDTYRKSGHVSPDGRVFVWTADETFMGPVPMDENYKKKWWETEEYLKRCQA